MNSLRTVPLQTIRTTKITTTIPAVTPTAKAMKTATPQAVKNRMTCRMKSRMKKVVSSPLIAALSLTVLSASKAHSELLYQPSIPESIQPENLIETLPENPESREGIADVVLKELKGVVFHNTPDNLFLSGWPGEPGIMLDHLDVPGDKATLLAQLQDYIGKPATFIDLNDIRRLVENWFINHDLPVIQVIAPPGQEITSGIVQYVVVSGQLGEMNVDGAEYNDPEWLISQMHMKPRDQLSSRKLNRQLAWLNRNPFREVNAMLGAGSEFGMTDVTLKVADRKPERFFVRFDNTGTKNTDQNRWVAGFNLANLWKRDHMLSYQYTSSFNSRHLKAHAVDYRMPLPWQHIAAFTGAHVNSKPKLIITSTSKAKAGDWAPVIPYLCRSEEKASPMK